MLPGWEVLRSANFTLLSSNMSLGTPEPQLLEGSQDDSHPHSVPKASPLQACLHAACARWLRRVAVAIDVLEPQACVTCDWHHGKHSSMTGPGLGSGPGVWRELMEKAQAVPGWVLGLFLGQWMAPIMATVHQTECIRQSIRVSSHGGHDVRTPCCPPVRSNPLLPPPVQILLRLPNFSARDLATLAFGLAKQRRFDSLLFSQIAEAIVPLVPALDPQGAFLSRSSRPPSMHRSMHRSMPVSQI